MKKGVGLNLMAVFAVIIALSACAARTPVEPAPTPANPETMKKISVLLREFKVGPGVENGEIALAQSKIIAKSHLQSKNLFKMVEEYSGKTYEPPAMIIDVQLMALRIVGAGARFWVGPLAGRSHMKMLVTITDAQGNQLTQKELLGMPNAIGGGFSVGDSDRNLPIAMGQLLSDHIISEASKIQ